MTGGVEERRGQVRGEVEESRGDVEERRECVWRGGKRQRRGELDKS